MVCYLPVRFLIPASLLPEGPPQPGVALLEEFVAKRLKELKAGWCSVRVAANTSLTSVASETGPHDDTAAWCWAHRQSACLFRRTPLSGDFRQRVDPEPERPVQRFTNGNGTPSTADNKRRKPPSRVSSIVSAVRRAAPSASRSCCRSSNCASGEASLIVGKGVGYFLASSNAGSTRLNNRVQHARGTGKTIDQLKKARK